jgi:hypothetical protein
MLLRISASMVSSCLFGCLFVLRVGLVMVGLGLGVGLQVFFFFFPGGVGGEERRERKAKTEPVLDYLPHLQVDHVHLLADALQRRLRAQRGQVGAHVAVRVAPDRLEVDVLGLSFFYRVLFCFFVVVVSRVFEGRGRGARERGEVCV